VPPVSARGSCAPRILLASRPQVVGGPALPTLPLAAAAVAAWDVTSGDNGAGAGDEGWAATAGTCAGPVGGWGAVEACGRVGAVMDMLDPVVSGVDGRMGLRQVPARARVCVCQVGLRHVACRPAQLLVVPAVPPSCSSCLPSRPIAVRLVGVWDRRPRCACADAAGIAAHAMS
jgi:hypothetical protein